MNLISFEYPDIFTLLVRHNADSHILFQDYLPPLILAVYLQHRELVELFIRLGVDPNHTDTKMGQSALHYAAYFHDNTDIFHILLSSTIHHTIDINAKDYNGYSVLDYARANIHGSTAIMNLLLQLHVFDFDRGEETNDDIKIQAPNIKLFESSNELSSLKTKPNETKKALPKMNKRKVKKSK